MDHTTTAAPAVPPAPALPAATRAPRRVLHAAAVLGLVLAGLITLLVIGVDVGPVALATGVVLAAVPVPLYVFVALRIDRFEPEPLRLLAWAFFWGASAATLIALVVNSAGQALVGSSFGSQVGELYGSSISAPVVEESAKGAVLFAIYRWRRAELDGVLDGLVYAAMVGLGFAMTENFLYYGHAAVEGGVPLAATFFVRGVMAPFTHPVFTAMTGIGLGIAAQSARPATRVLAPLAGLATAMMLHSVWNTSATLGGGVGFFGVFVVIMVPVFVVLIVLIAVALGREGRVIRAELQPGVATGLLDAGDPLILSALRERRRLRRAARRDGAGVRRAAREWASTATELAFLRHRVARGLRGAGEDAPAQEAALVARLAALGSALGPATNAVRQAAAERAAQQPQLAAARPSGGGLGAPAPPGWHPDPWAQTGWRWWDGSSWTHHVAT